jgi:hypothetical protein
MGLPIARSIVATLLCASQSKAAFLSPRRAQPRRRDDCVRIVMRNQKGNACCALFAHGENYTSRLTLIASFASA